MSGRPESRTILFVEDNPDDRLRIHRMLRGQRRDYQLVDCGTGAEAVERIRKEPSRFDCVLLDQFLPDMTGEQVLQRLREPSGRIPVAVSVLTGHDDDAAAARALELGAEDYLLKEEVTTHALTRSIENVIE